MAGLDYSQEMVRQATQRNGDAVKRGQVEITYGNVRKLPYGEGTFDKVCGIETFYFWPDPLKGLREAHRVLKVGGELAITLEMSKEAAKQTSKLRKYLSQRYAERSARLGLMICSGAELTGMMRRGGVPQRPVCDRAEPIPGVAVRSLGSDRRHSAGSTAT